MIVWVMIVALVAVANGRREMDDMSPTSKLLIMFLGGEPDLNNMASRAISQRPSNNRDYQEDERMDERRDERMDEHRDERMDEHRDEHKDKHKDKHGKPEPHFECPFLLGSCMAAEAAHKKATEAHRACIEQRGYAQAEKMCMHRHHHGEKEKGKGKDKDKGKDKGKDKSKGKAKGHSSEEGDMEERRHEMNTTCLSDKIPKFHSVANITLSQPLFACSTIFNNCPPPSPSIWTQCKEDKKVFKTVKHKCEQEMKMAVEQCALGW